MTGAALITIGALVILAALIAGLRGVRITRENASAADAGDTRLEDALLVLVDAFDRSQYAFLRDLIERKVGEAHAMLVNRMAAEERARFMSARARMRRLGQ